MTFRKVAMLLAAPALLIAVAASYAQAQAEARDGANVSDQAQRERQLQSLLDQVQSLKKEIEADYRQKEARQREFTERAIKEAGDDGAPQQRMLQVMRERRQAENSAGDTGARPEPRGEAAGENGPVFILNGQRVKPGAGGVFTIGDGNPPQRAGGEENPRVVINGKEMKPGAGLVFTIGDGNPPQRAGADERAEVVKRILEKAISAVLEELDREPANRPRPQAQANPPRKEAAWPQVRPGQPNRRGGEEAEEENDGAEGLKIIINGKEVNLGKGQVVTNRPGAPEGRPGQPQIALNPRPMPGNPFQQAPGAVFGKPGAPIGQPGAPGAQYGGRFELREGQPPFGRPTPGSPMPGAPVAGAPGRPQATAEPARQLRQIHEMVSTLHALQEACANPGTAAMMAIAGIKDENPRNPQAAISALEGTLKTTRTLALRTAIHLSLKDLYKADGNQEKALEHLRAVLAENDEAISAAMRRGGEKAGADDKIKPGGKKHKDGGDDDGKDAD